tara:strand:+ start:146 stop:463 length:318 start_codon:yes stop_codon:yes gene_type:complete
MLISFISYLIYLLIFLYLFNRYKRKLSLINEELKPCINWALKNGYKIPVRPRTHILFLVEYWFFCPVGLFALLIPFLPVAKSVRIYKKSMKNLVMNWENTNKSKD